MGCDVVIWTLVDVAYEGMSITRVVRVFNILKCYAMMIGVLTMLLMGLALTPDDGACTYPWLDSGACTLPL